MSKGTGYLLTALLFMFFSGLFANRAAMTGETLPIVMACVNVLAASFNTLVILSISRKGDAT